eukprot:13000442-Heterocapsa_arctica.AAC.1
MRLIHIGSILYTLIGNYLGDDWDFLIIGTEERGLEYNNDTEVVHGIVSLGPDLPGEVRVFQTPSHQGTFHVSPCAIVSGSNKKPTQAVPVTGMPGGAGNGIAKAYDRVLIEGFCNPSSVMCRDTKESKGCLTILRLLQSFVCDV